MSSPNCTQRNHHHSNVFELIILTSEASLILLINTAFLIALFRRRKFLNWKSTVFVANVATSDFLCSFSLVAMAGNLFNLASDGFEDEFQYSLQLVTTYSTGITMLNYHALFSIQYISIKHPIFYQTRCTRRSFIYLIIGQWAALTGYVALKAVMIDNSTYQLNFSKAELVLMAFFMLFNTITYGYVLHVSTMQTMQHSERRREKSKEKFDSGKILCRILFRDYRNTITAGLHLIIYIGTFAPMWVVRVYVALDGCPDRVHCGDRANIYACACAVCRVTFYIWYLRAILDPLLQMTRERQLCQEWLRWAACLCPWTRHCGKESIDNREITIVQTSAT